MGLRESPYSSRFLGGLDAAIRDVLFPGYWLTNQLLALQQTTEEKRAGVPLSLRVAVRAPPLLLLLLLYSPLALLALVLWLPLQAARRPFAYRHTPSRSPPEPWGLPGQARAVSLVCGNVCLLPEGLAKFSNLYRTQRRATYIAQSLAQAAQCPAPSSVLALQRSLPGPPTGVRSHPQGDTGVTVELSPTEKEAAAAAAAPVASGPREITACFPPSVDFLCLQEVFDLRACTRLCQHLSPHYEHIIYDVGTYGLQACSALKLLNSGLFLASRYPILAVEYHCYPNGTREDALCAKGLLCAQVQLGTCQGRRVVGYLNCTHLHANEVDAPIRYDQLSLSLLWAQLFQDTHAQPGDVVAFDIYCGDLNFDTCSSCDELEQAHELFRLYTDPCRVGPRKDKPWAIGTLMNYLRIYDEAVATPENLKRTLENLEEQRKYLACPILANGSPDLSTTCYRGRRIDYILYREHTGPVELKTTVEKVFFITQLAACSDHLPVGLRLLVSSVGEPDV